MKAMIRALLLSVCFAIVGAAASENEAVPMPTELMLKNGFVMRKVSEVTKISGDGVMTVRYVGGLAPVRFDGMSPDSLEAWTPFLRQWLEQNEQDAKDTQEKAARKEVAASDERAAAREREHQDILHGRGPASPEMIERAARAAREGRVVVGMSGDQARRVWGEPNKINRTSAADGQHEQWIFRRGRGAYIYVDNGIVTAVQESDR